MKTTTVLRWAFLAALLSPATSPAATYTWTGAGFFGNRDYLWSNPNNWAGLTAPSPGEANVTIVFPDNNSPKVTTNDIVGLSVAVIQFAGSNYVVHGKPAGNALTLYGTGFGGWSILASQNANYFAGTSPLVLSNLGSVSVASGATLSVLSGISGGGSLTKFGSGTLKYAAGAANTYTGTTTVSDGTLDLNNGTSSVNTFPAIAGPLVIGSTNMSFSPLVRLLLNDQIADAQPVMIYENGRLWLNGKNDALGAITLRGGAEITTGVGGGSSSPGVLTLLGNVTCSNSPYASYASIRGLLDLGLLTRTFHVEGWLRVYANISGGSIFNPGVTKTGAGSLQFTQVTNSYTGPTLVQQGQLHLYGGASPLGTTNAGTTVSAGAELYLENVSLGAEALTLNGGGNTTVLAFRGSNVCSGPITLNGNCRLHNDYWYGEPHDLTLGGAIGGAGSLRKTGNGNLRFTGVAGNTFTGGFACEEGWAFLSKSASAPALSGPLVVGRAGEQFQWVFVEITETNQIPDTVPVTLLDHGSLSTQAGISETIGPLDITGGLIYANGPMTLGGDVTNHLSTNSVGFLTGNVVLPGTRIIHCDANSSLQAGGTWSGAGGVTKTGPGELLFGSAHSYAGATLVKEGKLTLSSSGRPGSSAAGTTVEANGTLYLNGASVTNESLVLHGGGNGVALAYSNTNVWSGPAEVHNGVTLKAEPVARLSILGAIAGDGGLHHNGDGTLILGGNTDNTFSGAFHFNQGTARLSKPSTVAAVPGDLVIGFPTNGAPPASVQATAPYQFKSYGFPDQRVIVNPSGQLLCGGFDQTISNLELRDGWVDAIGGNLVLLRDLSAEAVGDGQSYLFGQITLLYGDAGQHQFAVGSNAVCWLFANIREDPLTQHLTKTGTGILALSGSNSFTGVFTIAAGTVFAGGAQPFGTPSNPTLVLDGGTLVPAITMSAEPLQLAGLGHTNGGALRINGTNVFTGPVTLTAPTLIHTETNGLLTLAGGINGPGGFTKQGAGTMQLTGTNANTYAGATVVNLGKLELGKTNAIAVPGPLTVSGPNSASQVRLLQSEQIADTSAVVLQDTGWIALEGNNETIGSLAGVGAIYQSAGQTGLLTVGGNADSTTFNGTILGGGGLTKTGAGTFTLTANNTYTGTTTVNGGTLLVMGQQPQSPVSILTGGTLGGTGRVGHINDLNGHVAPGASPGILVCSNFATFSPTNLLQFEIAGPTPGLDYDQLQVNGTVLLMGGQLAVQMNYAGAVSNQYVLIANDGVEPVTGTLTGLPEGAGLTNNGASFVLTYHGGDGNDVALIQQTLPTGSRIVSAQWLTPSAFQLTASGTPNTHYRVEGATNLTPPIAWEILGEATADQAGELQFTDGQAGAHPMRFYRLRLP